MIRNTVLAAILASAISSAGLALAAAPPPSTIVLTLRDHRFTPKQVSAKAGEKFVIKVNNLDGTPEEFESHDFKVEKIVVPHGSITVGVGPLKPGTYAFFGDYHPETAKGVLTVSPPGNP